MLKNKRDLRVVFMGTPIFSMKILASLLADNYNIVGIFTQPDKKIGRKQIIEKSPVKILAEKNNIPVFTPPKLDADSIEKLNELRPDLIILIAYGKILPQAILNLPKLGAINIHPSLLPKFRGPSPIQNALLNNEKITGVTIMLMNAGMDTGDILRQKEIAIEANENYLKLSDRLNALSIQTLLETLNDFLAGKIVPLKQTDDNASYCQLIKKGDGKIDWKNDSIDIIYNKYRAFASWPGIFSIWNNKRLKIHEISIICDTSLNHKLGEIFKNNGAICVQAKNGVIELQEVQLEGKSSMQISEFINGYQDFVGSILI